MKHAVGHRLDMRFLNGPTSLPALLSCDLSRKGVEVGPLCKGMLAFPYSLYRKTGANPHRPEESVEIRHTFPTRVCSKETLLTIMPPCSLLLRQRIL